MSALVGKKSPTGETLYYSLVWNEPERGLHWVALGDADPLRVAMELDMIVEEDFYTPGLIHGTHEWTYAWMPHNGGVDG